MREKSHGEGGAGANNKERVRHFLKVKEIERKWRGQTRDESKMIIFGNWRGEKLVKER